MSGEGENLQLGTFNSYSREVIHTLAPTTEGRLVGFHGYSSNSTLNSIGMIFEKPNCDASHKDTHYSSGAATVFGVALFLILITLLCIVANIIKSTSESPSGNQEAELGDKSKTDEEAAGKSRE